jgi:hypothetical protein
MFNLPATDQVFIRKSSLVAALAKLKIEVPIEDILKVVREEDLFAAERTFGRYCKSSP